MLRENGETSIDSLGFALQLPVSKLSALLLNLELAGIVHSLPGKVYKIV